MYYCLTSKRVIGDYTQNISSYQRHSPVNTVSGNTNPLLNLHNQARNELKTFDGSWNKGNTEWLDLQAHDDYDNSLSPYANPAVTGIVTFNTPKATNDFKTVTFRIKNVSMNLLVGVITSTFFNLTGLDLTSQSVRDATFLTNAVLILHPKEDDENANV